MPSINIGGVPITPVNDTEKKRRLTMLIWGEPGCGKTVLAATAPGKKLLVNFDPEGPASITSRDDVLVADLSTAGASIAMQFKNDSPLGIEGALRADPDIETVIVDSLTNATIMAVDQGISQTKGATVERPSPGAYGVRNALTLKLVKNMLRVTGKYNKHCIFIGHEASPVTDDNGTVMFITIQLGGQLPNQVPIDFSEIWGMSVTDKGEYRIATRPARMRRPCRTRMFSTKERSGEFVWKYDPDSDEGMTIESFYEEWAANEFQKIALPK